MSQRLWMVSAPNEGGRNAFESMHAALDQRSGACEAHALPLPDFRVGTLDSLLSVSDTIARDDKALEMTVDRVLRQFRDLVPGGTPLPLVDGDEVMQYVTDFEWDEAKFSSADSLSDVRKAIMDQVARLEEDMKIRSTDFSSTKQQLSAIARKSQGNLMARSLATIVTADDVMDSPYLTTVFVVFPAYMEAEFLENYEQLGEMVVPRSAREIVKESDYALFGVIVFKRDVENFKAGCRDRRYTVREFKFEPDAAEKSAEEETRLAKEAKEQHALFAKWSETAFAEIFIAMVHLKALRMFVESVLRYGLPVNFEVALLKPANKAEGRLRTQLNEMFGHLGGSWAAAGDDDTTVPGLGADGKFYPYCYLEMPVPK